MRYAANTAAKAVDGDTSTQWTHAEDGTQTTGALRSQAQYIILDLQSVRTFEAIKIYQDPRRATNRIGGAGNLGQISIKWSDTMRMFKFEELSATAQAAARSLGFTPSTWDGTAATAASSLATVTSVTAWMELSAEQQADAGVLGYSREAWESCNSAGADPLICGRSIVTPSTADVDVTVQVEDVAMAAHLIDIYVTDRVCTPLTECGCSQRQDRANTATMDRTCAPMSLCNSDEYESQYPTKQWIDRATDVFVYTTDRTCTSFTDIVLPADAMNLCENSCATSGDGTCDDGGTGSVSSTCAWGTDCADCGSREHNDCLPFYHKNPGAGGVAADRWSGQYWNADTVVCTLPDAIVTTTAGLPYSRIASNTVAWPFTEGHDDFVGLTKELTFSAKDNFFSDTRIEGAAWGVPTNRNLVTITTEAGDPIASNRPLATGAAPTYTNFAVSDVPFRKDTSKYIPCTDGNAWSSGHQVSAERIVIKLPGDWTDGAFRTCAHVTGPAYCSVMGATSFNSENLNMNDACCACGGGVRATGYKLQATSRDPAADGLSDTDVINVEKAYHTSAAYAPPSLPLVPSHIDTPDCDTDPATCSWCVAQRVDTCSFTVYVYDNESPQLTCAESFTVCTEGGNDGETAENYAIIKTAGFATVGFSAGDVSILYPQRVTDNVDADMTFSTASPIVFDGAPSAEIHFQPDASTSPYTSAPKIVATASGRTVTTETSALTLDSPIADAQAVAQNAANRYYIGSYTVTFTATDSFDNEHACAVAVTVKDCAPPKFTTCAAEVADTKHDVCYCTVGNIGEHNRATDNSGISPKVLMTVDGRPVDGDFKFPIGATTVAATATDVSGAVPCVVGADDTIDTDGCNAAGVLVTECSFVVTCNDDQAPVAICPEELGGACDSTVTGSSESEYGTIGEGIHTWPPPVQQKDNSGVTQAGKFFANIDGVATEITVGADGRQTSAHRFPWYEATTVTYKVTDKTGAALEALDWSTITGTDDSTDDSVCTISLRLQCSIGIWMVGASFKHSDECSADQMTCLTSTVANRDSSAYAGDGYILLSGTDHASATEAGATAAGLPLTPWTTHLDRGLATDELGFKMYWKPVATTAGAAAFDNRGTYLGETEDLDCDSTGIIDNEIQIADPDGEMMVEMDAINVPEGVCTASKPCVYKFDHRVKAATGDDSFSVAVRGVLRGAAGVFPLETAYVCPDPADLTVCPDVRTTRVSDIDITWSTLVFQFKYSSSKQVAFAAFDEIFVGTRGCMTEHARDYDENAIVDGECHSTHTTQDTCTDAGNTWRTAITKCITSDADRTTCEAGANGWEAEPCDENRCCNDDQALNYKCTSQNDAFTGLRIVTQCTDSCSDALHDSTLCNSVDNAARIYQLRSEMQDLDTSQQLIKSLISSVAETLSARRISRASYITADRDIACPAGTEPAGSPWYLAPDPCTPCADGTTSPSGRACRECPAGCSIITVTSGCDCSSTPVDKVSSELTVQVTAGLLSDPVALATFETSFKVEMAASLNIACACTSFTADMLVIDGITSSAGRRRLQDSLSIAFSIVASRGTLPSIPDLASIPDITVTGSTGPASPSSMSAFVASTGTRQPRCAAGEENVLGVCTTCTSNTFSSGMGDCAMCPAGTTVSADHAQCVTESCTPGYEPAALPSAATSFGATSTCVACPRGQVSDGTACQSCDAGQEVHTALDGSTTCGPCSGSCSPSCPSGQELSADGMDCVEVNECLASPNPCLIQNSCVDVDAAEGSYTCSCPADSVMDAGGTCVCSLACGGASQGACILVDSSFQCSCLTGWTGSGCTTDSGTGTTTPSGPAPPPTPTDACDAYPCEHGSQCNTVGSSYTCDCSSGFDGVNCANDIDECISGPCLNGGICADGVDSFTCDCLATVFGGSNCQTSDIDDECASSPCTGTDPDATCTNGRAVYTCGCSSREDLAYTGENCQTMTCPAGSQLVSVGLATNCVQCPAGEVSAGGGAACAACADGTSGNLGGEPGSTSCVEDCDCGGTVGVVHRTGCTDCTTRCRTGCEDHETSSAVAGCASVHGTCTHRCPSGQVHETGDDGFDRCQRCEAYEQFQAPNSCTACPAGTKQSTDGLSCVCDTAEGFTGSSCTCSTGRQPSSASPPTCEDINECATLPCGPNAAHCDNMNNEYACTCNAGWEATSAREGTCVDIDECSIGAADCSSTESCQNTDGSFACVTAACDGIDCGQAGGQGTCSSGSCVCNTGWSGTNCQDGAGPCAGTPCSNGAACSVYGSTFTCICTDGWTGSSCDQNENECLRTGANTVCQNDGVCTDLDPSGAIPGPGYSCACTVMRTNGNLVGYQGTNCDQQEGDSVWYVEGFARVPTTLFSSGQFMAEMAWIVAKGVAAYEQSRPAVLKSDFSAADVRIGTVVDEGTLDTKVSFFLRFNVNFEVVAGTTDDEFEAQKTAFSDNVRSLLNTVNNLVEVAFLDGTCPGDFTDTSTCEYMVALTSNDPRSMVLSNIHSTRADIGRMTEYSTTHFFQPNSVAVVVGDMLASTPNNVPGQTYYGLRRILGEPDNVCLDSNIVVTQGIGSCARQVELGVSNTACYCTDFSLEMDALLNSMDTRLQSVNPALAEEDGFPAWGIVLIAIGAVLLMGIVLVAVVPGAACDNVRNQIGCGKAGEGADAGGKYATEETASAPRT